VEAYFSWVALFLLLTMLAGFGRIVKGPKPPDRLLGIQLFGTTTVGVMLLLAQVTGDDALRNVALVLVLLSLLLLIAFISRTPPKPEAGDEG
jgi:multicomponent Na+:H+ antiporter subunit F